MSSFPPRRFARPTAPCSAPSPRGITAATCAIGLLGRSILRRPPRTIRTAAASARVISVTVGKIARPQSSGRCSDRRLPTRNARLVRLRLERGAAQHDAAAVRHDRERRRVDRAARTATGGDAQDHRGVAHRIEERAGVVRVIGACIGPLYAVARCAAGSFARARARSLPHHGEDRREDVDRALVEDVRAPRLGRDHPRHVSRARPADSRRGICAAWPRARSTVREHVDRAPRLVERVRRQEELVDRRVERRSLDGSLWSAAGGP